MKYIFILFMLFAISCNINAEEALNDDILFKGVTKQSSDYSCGAASLSTLITGLVENSHVTENDIMKEINSDQAKENGYTLNNLMNASKKLGYYTELQHVSVSELVKINIPVMLLIGLNIKMPHFVVLKGIKNKEAFLADPTRGNIRIPYEELIKEGTNNKHKEWFVIAIEPSTNKPKDSTLYLSDNENERHNSHLTVEQSNAITLATMPKSHQLLVNYGFTASLGNNKNNGLKINSETFAHTLNARYGITDNIQIGGSIQHSDNTTDIRFDNNKLSSNSSDRQYSLYGNHRFKLDDLGKTNLIVGVNGSYAEKNDIFGGGFSIIGYQNTEFAQIILGGSFGKEFSHNQLADESLPDYFYSGFIGANKPLGDRYLASVNFAVNDSKSKNKAENFDRSYSASTSLTYVFNKEFQISPSFTYSFGQADIFSFGLNIAYVGGW